MDFLPIPTFGGTFDGQGHTISGLDLTDPVAPAGIFSIVQESGVVKNLNVSGTAAPGGSPENVGGVVGINYGTLENCGFTGLVSGSAYVGGVAGTNARTGRLLNCTAAGAVMGENMTGGVTGYNLGYVSGCVNTAAVNAVSVDPTLDLEDLNFDFLTDLSKLSSADTVAAASDTGGIAGYSSGTLENCENSGTIGYPHIGYNVGGIAGRSCGYVAGCVNSGLIRGRKDVGGILGQMEPYIELELAADTINTLKEQLAELDDLVEDALNRLDSTSDKVANRLNKITSCIDQAAEALSVIETTADIDTEIDASANGSTEGSVTVTPPKAEAEGTIEGGSAGAADVIPPVVGGVSGGYISGDYVGGIAGITSATIRRCYSKAALAGSRYVGGIVGSGVAQSSSGDASLVANCYSLVTIDPAGQYIGAISGGDLGGLLENYFVSDDLAGVNRLSYTGRAEPISYEALLQAEGLPDIFREFTLTFVADEQVLKAVTFHYGDSFDSTVYPEIPARDGQYAHWDIQSLENLTFDTVVTLEYFDYVPSLSASPDGGSRPAVLVRGDFSESDALVVTALPGDCEEVLSLNLGKFLGAMFQGRTIPNEVLSGWSITLPEGCDSAQIRCRIDFEDTDRVAVYVREGSTWSRAEAQVIGSYIAFEATGSVTEAVVVKTYSVWWVWILVALQLLVTLLIVGFILFVILREIRKRRAK